MRPRFLIRFLNAVTNKRDAVPWHGYHGYKSGAGFRPSTVSTTKTVAKRLKHRNCSIHRYDTRVEFHPTIMYTLPRNIRSPLTWSAGSLEVPVFMAIW